MPDVPAYQKKPFQTPAEHDGFIEILKQENVRSYLEIGSYWGASLWKVAMALPKRSRIVSVDSLVDQPKALPSLQACIAALRDKKYDAHFVNGDSTDSNTVELVRQLAPFDALFIDGNHSFDYVQSDWKNYGPMARIVGFHDINWKDTWVSGKGKEFSPTEAQMGVPRFWDGMKNGYRYKEFRLHPQNNYHGIGVIWRS